MTHEELCRALLVERFAVPTPEHRPPRTTALADQIRAFDEQRAWQRLRDLHQAVTDQQVAS